MVYPMEKEDVKKPKWKRDAEKLKEEVNTKQESQKAGLDLKRNYLVKTAIGRVEKVKAGRPRKYTPTKMRNECNKYLQWCEDNDRVPSIKGLMIHLKMYKDQFYQYLKYPEFSDIMEQTRLVIAEWCENDIYRTPGAAAGKIAYMKNIHGWTEKVEQNSFIEQRTITVDEARSKIEMLAPKLLELMKNTNLVNQLITDKTIEGEVVDARG